MKKMMLVLLLSSIVIAGCKKAETPVATEEVTTPADTSAAPADATPAAPAETPAK